MAYERLYVHINEGLFSSALVAHGLARLNYDILYKGGVKSPSITLSKKGGYFQIDVAPPISKEHIESAMQQGVRLLPYLLTSDEIDPTPYAIDMNEQYQIMAEYREWLNTYSPKERWTIRRGETIPNDRPQRLPDYRYQQFRLINFKGGNTYLSGYSKLVEYWEETLAHQSELVHLILDAFARYGMTQLIQASEWRKWRKNHDLEMEWGPNPLQIVNPSRGKGQNRTKADRLAIGSQPKLWAGKSWWVIEYLKFSGFLEASFTRSFSGEQKTYVLIPELLDVAALYRIRAEFEHVFTVSTSIKADVIAVLRMAELLLRHDQTTSKRSRRSKPRDMIGGFSVATYMVQNSPVFMNNAYIGIPDWINAETNAERKALIETLGRHEQIIGQFDERRGEDIALLKAYRDFISGSDLSMFFAFTSLYAGFLISQRHQGKRARQLTTTDIERILGTVNRSYQDIVQRPGFRRIAGAIRNSTVNAQRNKGRPERHQWNIRYGLNQDLMRAAHNTDKFIAALGEFIASYNAETARRRELDEQRGQYRPPYRADVTTSDIEEILFLIDEHNGNTRLICNLLIAYGYAYNDIPNDYEQEIE